jgi:hypothetical protein
MWNLCALARIVDLRRVGKNDLLAATEPTSKLASSGAGVCAL